MKAPRFFVLSLILFVMMFGLTYSLSAALVDNGDGTVTQTRNDGSKLMWLKDASAGLKTWDQAKNWIAFLNSSNYLGYDDWRLPATLPINGISYNYADYPGGFDGTYDVGYNITGPNSEMGYMFYVELGNLGQYDTSGNPTGCRPQGPYCLTNTGLFYDMNANLYWTGTEYNGPDDVPDKAWGFNFINGDQYGDGKDGLNFVWAVRDVSEPISSPLADNFNRPDNDDINKFWHEYKLESTIRIKDNRLIEDNVSPNSVGAIKINQPLDLTNGIVVEGDVGCWTQCSNPGGDSFFIAVGAENTTSLHPTVTYLPYTNAVIFKIEINQSAVIWSYDKLTDSWTQIDTLEDDVYPVTLPVHYRFELDSGTYKLSLTDSTGTYQASGNHSIIFSDNQGYLYITYYSHPWNMKWYLDNFVLSSQQAGPSEIPQASGYYCDDCNFAVINWDYVSNPLAIQVRDSDNNIVIDTPYITDSNTVCFDDSHLNYFNASFRLIDQNGNSSGWKNFQSPPQELNSPSGGRVLWHFFTIIAKALMTYAAGVWAPITGIVIVPEPMMNWMMNPLCLTSQDYCFQSTALSPVDIKITDPEGFVISKIINELPSSSIYSEFDYFAIGDPKDIVIITNAKEGEYLIEIEPDNNGSINDTYSFYLTTLTNGVWNTVISDENQLVEQGKYYVFNPSDIDGDGHDINTDCNDNDDSIYPGAPEIPNDGLDQDCNGFDTVTCIEDTDQDGFGTSLGTTVLADDGFCDTAQSESATSDDCNDSDANINPDTEEVCDSVDNNCNGQVDEIDGDGDGVSDCIDNCPLTPNTDQSDVDGDGVGDVCDPCDNRPINGSISPSTDTLWPPNHEMVSVAINGSSLITRNPDTQVSITSVGISEYSRKSSGKTAAETNIYGENNFEPDCEITGAMTVNLRSERAGKSQGRTYTIIVTATDCSGSYNFTTQVEVPHDQGN